MSDFDKLLAELGRPGVHTGILVLLACLAVAYGVSWLAGRHRQAESVWFGRAIFDGLLFPLLALVLSYIALLVLSHLKQSVPVLRIAVPILISLAGIRLVARVQTAVFPQSGLARLVERLFSWIAWVAAVLWIVGLLPMVLEELESIQFMFGKTRLNLLTIIQGILSSGAVLVLVLWISATVERNLLRDTVSDLSLRKVAANTLRAVLLLVGLLFSLSAVGVDLTALSVLGGALGVGLGLGLQKLAANYVSGFVILFERSLRIGDVIRVDGFEGEVVDIKTRYTLIRSTNGRESIVPNEKLITERIENLSLDDPRVLLTTEVTVGYASDPALVEQILVDAAAAAARVRQDPAPAARLARLGPDGLEFSVLFWISDPVNGQLNVRSDINLGILRGLRSAGIDIPSPQRVVHLKQVPDPAVISSGTAATD